MKKVKSVEQGLRYSVQCDLCRATLMEHWTQVEHTNIWEVSYTCECESIKEE